MEQSIKLTQKQQAQIYCVNHGHANFVWSCFGYVHCGRCGEQIGDTLAGIFSGAGMVVVGHDCSTCTDARKTLSKLDVTILERLEGDKSFTYDYDKILVGIAFS